MRVLVLALGFLGACNNGLCPSPASRAALTPDHESCEPLDTYCYGYQGNLRFTCVCSQELEAHWSCCFTFNNPKGKSGMCPGDKPQAGPCCNNLDDVGAPVPWSCTAQGGNIACSCEGGHWQCEFPIPVPEMSVQLDAGGDDGGSDAGSAD